MDGTVNCARREEGRPALGVNAGGAAEAAFAGAIAAGAAAAGGLGTAPICFGRTGFATTGCAAAFTFSTGLTSGRLAFLTTWITFLGATLDAGFWFLVLAVAFATALTGLFCGAIGAGLLAAFFSTNKFDEALPGLEAGLTEDLGVALTFALGISLVVTFAVTLRFDLATGLAMAFTGALATFLPVAFTAPIDAFFAVGLGAAFADAPDFTLATGLTALLTAIPGFLD